jgi:sec-independent protein translocase protein TatA
MTVQGDRMPALLFIPKLPEILFILAIAMLLFGGKKIGDLGKGLGEGIKNFKSAVKGDDEKPEDKKPEDKKPV